jgi:hypothetical protein
MYAYVIVPARACVSVSKRLSLFLSFFLKAAMQCSGTQQLRTIFLITYVWHCLTMHDLMLR